MDLSRLSRQFEDIDLDAARLVAPLREDQFAWKPAPDVWSIRECLDHLNAAARQYLPRIDEAIANSLQKTAAAGGPFRYSWRDRVLVRASGPDSWVRVKAPSTFLPAADGSREDVLCALRTHHQALVERLCRANGIDLARARVTSPVARWLTFSLGAAFAMIAAHERRHLRQARAILASTQFPA